MKTQTAVAIFFLLFISGARGSKCFAQSETKKVTIERQAIAIPTGDVQPTAGFSVSYDVESRLELMDGPVKVLENASRVEDGIGMTRVLIENRSSKEVVAVRLHWYLFRDENSKSFVKDAETKEIKVDRLMPKEQRVVASGIPGFDEMFKSLSKNGLISGSYQLEAVISEVRFADDSKWQLPKRTSGAH